jgi:hypothetical protein
MDVNSLIRRLIEELKSRFQLTRDLPVSQERLSWELPRFFDLASKKGSIIIVIDGLNRLRMGNDSGRSDYMEASLAWLPLEFPPNVRVILSVTEHPDIPLTSHVQNKGKNDVIPNTQEIELLENQAQPTVSSKTPSNQRKPHRILSELQRRRWQMLHLKPLERAICKGVVESYVRKTVQTEATPIVNGPFLTAINDSEKANPDEIPGFLLFDSQITMLLSHSLGGTPIFLRFFLRCAHLAVSKGFCIWLIWDDWLKADSIPALMTRIIISMEDGFKKTREETQKSCDRTVNAGGLPALKVLYPWHPSFEDQNEFTTDLVTSFDFRQTADNADNEMKANTNPEQTGNGLSDSVLQNLGDQNWVRSSEKATTSLEESRMHCRVGLETLLNDASQSKRSNDKNTKVLVEDVINNIMRVRLQSIGSVDSSDDIHNGIDDDISSNSYSVKYTRSKLAALTSFSDIRPEDSLELSDDENSLEESILSNEGSSQKYHKPYTIDEERSHHQCDDDISEDSSLELAVPVNRSKSPLPKESTDKKRANSMIRRKESHHAAEATYSKNDKKQDPSDQLWTLPPYLRGGSNCEGFGTLLGNALALLYVARHGLKESELWAILSILQSKTLNYDNEEYKRNSMNEHLSRNLLSLCYQTRGHLEDLFRTEDSIKSGKITVGQLHHCLVRVHSTFKKADAMRIIEITDMSLSSDDTEDNIQRSSDRVLFDYMELLRRIIRKERDERQIEQKKKVIPKQDTKPVDSELGLDFPKQDSEDNINNDDVEDIQSIGPLVEESLLSVLCALGVLHSPENQVMILPSDTDQFRQVVFNRYVDAIGGEESWHGHLIRFFQRQMNSMRRCEELPWHLQICRKWYALRDAMADLRTFEMMYGLRGDGDDGLKGEYMSYWLTLTEGPLFTTDAAAKAYIGAGKQQQVKGNNSIDNPQQTKILSEIDTAAALGLTEKESRKMLLKNQVAPFDIVEEFNKSMEIWVVTVKPNASTLKFTIMLIAKYMYDFSRRSNSPPPFLRLGVDLQALLAFGVTFDELKEQEAYTNDKSSTISKKNTLLFPTQQQMAGKNYYYLRWLWVQFPYIALEHAGVTASSIRDGSMSLKGPIKSAEIDLTASNDDSLSKLRPPVMTMKGLTSNQRYWDVKKTDPTSTIVTHTPSRQFALLNNSTNNLDTLDIALKRIQEGLKGVTKPPQKFRRTFDQEIGLLDGIPHATHCSKSMRLETLFPSMDTFIKKRNAVVESDLGNYEKASLSLRRGGQGLPLEPSVDDEIKRLSEEESLKNWNSMRGGAIPLGTEEELEYDKELNRLGRLRTISDRVTKLSRERKALLSDIKLQVRNRDELDDEMTAAVLTGEMAIATLEERFLDLSAAVEKGKSLNQGFDLLIELLVAYPPHREKHIVVLEQNVALAKQQVVDLQRLRQSVYLDAERVELVKKRQLLEKIKYYSIARRDVEIKRKKIISQLPGNHVDQRRTKVAFTKVETIDVKSDNLSLNLSEASEASSIQRPVSAALLKIGKGYNEASRLSKAHLYDDYYNKTEDSNTHSSSSITSHDHNKKSSNQKGSPGHRHKKNHNQTEVEVTPEKELVYDKESIMREVVSGFQNEKLKQQIIDNASSIQAEMMFSFVTEKTGSSSEEEFIQRFNSGQKLTESLRSQQILADSKLAHLRSEYNELYSSWGELLFVGSGDDEKDGKKSGAEPDARYLDNHLFFSEMRLNQTHRQYESSIISINEVRTGVNHLLVLLSCNSKMLQNLPRSVQPQIRSTSDIGNCLSWIEERILAVNEAMALDNSKPSSQIDDSKPFFERQIDLAVIVQDDQTNSGRIQRLTPKKKKKRDKNPPGIDMSEAYVSLTDAVVVRALAESDKQYFEKTSKLNHARDKNAENREIQQLLDRKGDVAKGTALFIKEALSTAHSKESLRKANVLTNSKQGPYSGFGVVLEDLIESTGVPILRTGSENKDKKNVNKDKDTTNRRSHNNSNDSIAVINLQQESSILSINSAAPVAE